MTRILRCATLLAVLTGCPPGHHSGESGPPHSGDSGSDSPGDSLADSGPVDRDGDGSPASEDCDDDDPGRHPGAEEHCDGVDEDCDDLVDEDPVDAPGWFADRDGDGFGDPEGAFGLACEGPEHHVSEATDCDDANSSRHPGACDPLHDDIDQDCSGADGPGVQAEPVAVTWMRPGQIVIAELMHSPQAAADGEWIELTNSSSVVLDLDGLVISDGASRRVQLAGPRLLEPGEAFVLGASDDRDSNGGAPVDHAYGEALPLGESGQLVLSGLLELDRVSWSPHQGFPNTPGAALALHPSTLAAANNEQAGFWCAASSSYGLGDLGTPGSPNDACTGFVDSDNDGHSSDVDCDDQDPAVHPGATEIWYDGIDQDCAGDDDHDRDGDLYRDTMQLCADCDDGDPGTYPGAPDLYADGTDNDCDGGDGPQRLVSVQELSAGDLVIVELLQDPEPEADEDAEWVEVFNFSGADVDLAGLVISDDGADRYTVLASTVVPRDGLFLLGANSDPVHNGGVTLTVEYVGVTLEGVDQLVLENDAGVIDAVAWDGGASFPDPVGASMSLHPMDIDEQRNDLGESWCEGRSVGHFSGFGTPGSENDICW
jgi:hypothetical protein